MQQIAHYIPMATLRMLHTANLVSEDTIEELQNGVRFQCIA